jgi:serine phosphatase RsbU (regulator of sigma subunit)
LFYSHILSSHSEIVLLSLIVLHILPMDVHAFLVSVIYHRIEKTMNVHLQYQILNLNKLCSDLS